MDTFGEPHTGISVNRRSAERCDRFDCLEMMIDAKMAGCHKNP